MNLLPERVFLESDFIRYAGCPICESTNISEIGKKATIHPRSRFSVLIKRCLNCEHWYTDPMPNSQLLSILYAESSLSVLGEKWADGVRTSNVETFVAPNDHWVVKNLEKMQPGNFLEIGPGSGSLLRKMRNYGWNAFGVDLGDYAKGFQVVSSPKQLPDSISFDVIVFQDVLEHVSIPKNILLDYLPYLTRDATLFMAVPWSESRDARRGKTSWEMVRPLGHLHYFSRGSARILLESTGFNVIDLKTVYIYGSPTKALIMSMLNLAYGMIRPSKWRTLPERLGSVRSRLRLFPVETAGDQLCVIAQKSEFCR